MKVITEGDNKKAQWWVGLLVKCEHCGRAVRLEPGDMNRFSWVRHDIKSATLACECCWTQSTVNNRGAAK